MSNSFSIPAWAKPYLLDPLFSDYLLSLLFAWAFFLLDSEKIWVAGGTMPWTQVYDLIHGSEKCMHRFEGPTYPTPTATVVSGLQGWGVAPAFARCRRPVGPKKKATKTWAHIDIYIYVYIHAMHHLLHRCIFDTWSFCCSVIRFAWGRLISLFCGFAAHWPFRCHVRECWVETLELQATRS